MSDASTTQPGKIKNDWMISEEFTMGCWQKQKVVVPLALLSVSPFVLADEAKQSIEQSMYKVK